MPRLDPRLVAACALVSLMATGCGGTTNGQSGASSATPGRAPSSDIPAASSPQQTVDALTKRIEAQGAGHFTQRIRSVGGTVLTSITGRYSLENQQLSATIRTPDNGGAPSTQARVDLVGSRAYLQVAQWKKPSRGCWLRTTTSGLSTAYLLDLASAEEVPIAVQLVDAFTPVSDSGGGVISGTVEITAALPLLTGSVKRQLTDAKPKGTVEAFLTVEGDGVLVTVPGYALSRALSSSLLVDESKFAAIAGVRYEAGVTTSGSVPVVTPPAKDRQMSAADLQANRCG